jgi:hypothetical protein
MATIHADIGHNRYRLTLNSAGQPYVLKRYPDSRLRPRFGIVWAEWHKGLPTGAQRIAIEVMGFVWRNDDENTIGWHNTTAGRG